MGKTKRARPSKSKKSKSKNRKTKRKKDKYYKSRFRSMRGRPSKILELKSRTPELNIKLRKSVQKSIPDKISKTNKKIKSITKSITKSPIQSYSPSINRALKTLQSLTPEYDIFTCEDGEIKIKQGSGFVCKNLAADSQAIKDVMLKNLNIKSSKIKFDNVLAPQQALSNCWFNCFFMIFFISDKGRKFFRYLRHVMITGILPNKTHIEPSMKLPFLMLNFFIEASLIGTNDPRRFADVMNTNILIHNIGNELKKKNLDVPSINEPGNPINFYMNIMKYLDNDIILMKSVTRRIMNRKNIDFFLDMNKKIPDILYVNQTDVPDSELKEVYKYVIKDKKVRYKLDSAIIRSQDEGHYTAYITGNGKQYAFDGASFSRLIPFKWKSKINTEITWRFSEDTSSIFDFKTCYVTFFYYRY